MADTYSYFAKKKGEVKEIMNIASRSQLNFPYG